jgi:RecA/RadA recombinase
MNAFSQAAVLPPNTRDIRRAVEEALAGRVAAPFAQNARIDFDRLPTGIAALDQLTGGLPRGALTEICGPGSSGRTTAMVSALAQATSNGEACCLIDVTDAFDPRAAAAAGVDLGRVLWVRCGESRSLSAARLQQLPNCESAGPPNFERQKEKDKRQTAEIQNSQFKDQGCSSGPFGNSAARQSGNRTGGFAALEQALKITDLVLQGGGFGLVVIDLSDLPPRIARRVPLTSWFRFRRAVEKTRTVLLVAEQEANAGACAALIVNLRRVAALRGEQPVSHARLLHGIEIHAEIARAPGRKQPQRATATFSAESEWQIG